ncbi:hypothetical protein ES707_02187 [subsurface metagenome]
MPALTKNKKLIIRLLISITITVFFIYFIVKNLNINDFKNLINSINIYFILIALSIHTICYLVRSLRILVLLKIKFSEFNNIFFTVSRHYILNKILPVRIGELSLVYFLKNEQEISYTKGLGALLYLRILDLLAVPLFFIVAFSINFSSFSNSNNIIILLIFLILFIMLFFVFIFLGKILNLILKFLKLLPKKIKWLEKNIYFKFLEKYKNLADEINKFIKLKTNIKVIILTILNRLLNSLVAYTIFFGFGISIGFINFIIGSTLSILTEALPVSGIGSFGTFEAGWTLGFVLIGYNQKLSLLTGFGVNIIFFIFTIFLLIISFFLSKYREIITRKFLKLVKGNS